MFEFGWTKPWCSEFRDPGTESPCDIEDLGLRGNNKFCSQLYELELWGNFASANNEQWLWQVQAIERSTTPGCSPERDLTKSGVLSLGSMNLDGGGGDTFLFSLTSNYNLAFPSIMNVGNKSHSISSSVTLSPEEITDIFISNYSCRLVI